MAGADANPYLVIAASLAAGLAGMDEQLPATEPITGNGYGEAHTLPRQLDSAEERMRQSKHSRRLLGDDFVTGYTAVKALEHDSYLAEITAWERRYLLPQA